MAGPWDAWAGRKLPGNIHTMLHTPGGSKLSLQPKKLRAYIKHRLGHEPFHGDGRLKKQVALTAAWLLRVVCPQHVKGIAEHLQEQAQARGHGCELRPLQ